VTFNANGGAGTMAPQVANAPTALTLNTFTRAGYSFNGWNTAADGSGTGYADGETYSFAADLSLYAQWSMIPRTTRTFPSIASHDGWMLESGEKTNKGATLNQGATTFILGDNAQKKQYRSILSFSTKGLPDNAVITKVTLKVRKQGVTGGGNPVNLFQGILVDFKKGFFGSAPGLLASDFQAKASKSYGPFKPALKNGWYTLNLTPAKGNINLKAGSNGVTQLRLRFKLDDNNNAIANYLSLYSGNAPAASRPQLIIEYYVP
jgi:uncharacterized repeat protein (TIGR02543 family)